MVAPADRFATAARRGKNSKIDGIVKKPQAVTPARAGVYNYLKTRDLRLRGDDETAHSETLYDTIKIKSL
jgi:hypothetical protein